MLQVDSGPVLVRWWLAFAGPCELLSLSGARATGTGNRFLQLYDRAAGPPPAATRPAVTLLWDGGTTLPLVPRWRFSNGLLVAMSNNDAVQWNDPGADQWTFQAMLGG